MRNFIKSLTIGLCCIAPLAVAEKDENYSPYAAKAYPQNVYWGDTHVHTTLSLDAYASGDTLKPEAAYRFAMGETVNSTSGQWVRLSRPLDFVVLADHSEFLGVFESLANDPAFVKSAYGKKINRNQINPLDTVSSDSGWNNKVTPPETFTRSVWSRVVKLADAYNQPKVFTAFIGYEWTSMPQGNNLHRNVIFRDDASVAGALLPVSSIASGDPENLWRFMARYETETGGQVLAIPHNGNGSNGLMFAKKDFSGNPLTTDYVKTRARWEPVYEVTQIKGDGETHPYLSSQDEFANYETWDTYNLLRTTPKEPWMLQNEYARSAFRAGLKHEKMLGVNPFKFGLVGSSDSHNSLSAVEENSFFGKFANSEPNAERIKDGYKDNDIKQSASKAINKKSAPQFANKLYSASGYAAVWAKENTREALFDAMQRKETYATTGPRMTVRFFGGWDFAENDDLRPDYDLIGYRKGVPMGGDLYKTANKNQAPKFLVVASKDPVGANLDRVQIIKGWLNADGTTAEKVYNVAVSNLRKIRKNKVKALNSSVDIKTATYTNSIGAIQLSTVWQDPEFKPAQRAFYYVRVLEIPTPRWTTYDAVFYGTELPEGVPAEHQERAYTSPIWYTPAQQTTP